MRKNGVNKELIPIDGGVCAPDGFKANGVYCGFDAENNPQKREDLALILADKLFPTACVYAVGEVVGAPVTITKKHVKRGYAQAVLVNSGVANVFGENSEKIAIDACKALAKKARLYPEEIVLASTGAMGKKMTIDPFLRGIDKLVDGARASHETSLCAARALMTTDTKVKQLSFSFLLGAYPCKIGAIFKGSSRVCPNMATTLCFLTTDVDITPEMLQKALVTASKNTFSLLTTDGVSSPNDTACIMASGRAGNYKIDCEDSEYKKFEYVLEEVLRRVCKTIAADGQNAGKVLVCQVLGARSKRTARAVAKAVVGALGVKRSVGKEQLDTESLLCAMISAGEEISIQKTSVSVCSSGGKLAVFEEEKQLFHSSQTEKAVLCKDEITFLVDLKEGNYGAIAYGCDESLSNS